MKKVMTILLSLVMVFAASAVAVPAMAEVGSVETTTQPTIVPTVEVNGKTTTEVTVEQDPNDPNVFTFTYTGDGTLEGWEFKNMKKGVMYVVLSEDGNKITIKLINGYTGPVEVNALVSEDEAEEEETKAAKKNKKATSPNTGAMSAAGIAAAGAGVAVLAALKKKNDAE